MGLKIQTTIFEFINLLKKTTMDRTIIFALVLFAIVPPYYLLMRLLFKNTVVLKLGIIMLLLFISMPWAAFFVADKGFIHIIWIVPFCFVFIFTTFYLILRLIRTPLRKLSQKVEQLSKGNLEIDFDDLRIDENNEITDISKSIIKHAHKLTEIINEIKNATVDIKTSSNELNQSSQLLSQTVSEQAASIEEISSSMEQIITHIQQNAGNVKKTDMNTGVVKAQLQLMQDTTEENKKAVGLIAHRIGIINDISFQTNILSLNAAVEAARAGDQGRGFSVVASEVRKLAERSKLAASEIQVLSAKSVKAAEDADQNFMVTSSQIQDTISSINEIAVASEEQHIGATQINTALEELNSTIQNTAASVEELAQTADVLDSYAANLNSIMSYFKIKESKDRWNLTSRKFNSQMN
jgi:methyl-accepting chemotaxis protein